VSKGKTKILLKNVQNDTFPTKDYHFSKIMMLCMGWKTGCSK